MTYSYLSCSSTEILLEGNTTTDRKCVKNEDIVSTSTYSQHRSISPMVAYIILLYNIYSTYIEIRLVETIPRDIYQSIVFPSQQHRISLSTISYSLIRNSQDLTLWSYNGIPC